MGILLPPNRFRRYSGIVVTWGPELSFCLPAALLPHSPNSEAQMVFLGFSVGDLRGRRKWGPKGGVRMNWGSAKSYVLNWGFPGGPEGKVSACNAGNLGPILVSGRSPGEGNSNPLQHPCLQNPMDGGAWWDTVHGVAKSRTRLSDFT